MFDAHLITAARITLGWTTDPALLLGFALLLGRMERGMRKGEKEPVLK